MAGTRVMMRRGHPSEAELTEYADGSLGRERIGPVEAHLSGCSDCAEGLARARGAAASLASLPTVPAPLGLRERVAQRLLVGGPAAIPCERAEVLLNEHLDGVLSPVPALALQQHLDQCTQCEGRLAALTATSHLLRSLPSVEAPSRIGQTVAAAQRARELRAPWSVRWRPALAATLSGAAVVGIVFLGVRTRRPVDSEAPLLVREQESARSPAVDVAAVGDLPAGPPAPVAEAEGELRAGAEAEAEPARVVAEMEPRPEARLVAHVLSPPAKGPQPAPRASEPVAPEFAVPSALRALQVVASAASDELEGQRELQLAGERFATMNSEAMWAQLPSLSPALEGDEGAVDIDKRPTAAPDEDEVPEAVEDIPVGVPSVPIREGAVPPASPLV